MKAVSLMGLFVATDNALSFTQGGQVVNFNMFRHKNGQYGLGSVVADDGNGAGKAVFDDAHITKLDRNLGFVLGEVAEMQAYIGGRDGVDMADAIGSVALRQLSVPMEAASAPSRRALTLAQ